MVKCGMKGAGLGSKTPLGYGEVEHGITKETSWAPSEKPGQEHSRAGQGLHLELCNKPPGPLSSTDICKTGIFLYIFKKFLL